MIIEIKGQIKGGKNNMIVTRTGHRFPRPEWATWRDDAVRQVRSQLPSGWRAIGEPVEMALAYFAGDKRRRDMPAVIDSIFHVFEKAGVVEDDTLIWISSSHRAYDKNDPHAVLTFNH